MHFFPSTLYLVYRPGAVHARLLWIDSLVSAWGAALPLDTERVAMPNPSNVCALAKMVSELKLHLADPAAAAAAAGSGA